MDRGARVGGPGRSSHLDRLISSHLRDLWLKGGTAGLHLHHTPAFAKGEPGGMPAATSQPGCAARQAGGSSKSEAEGMEASRGVSGDVQRLAVVFGAELKKERDSLFGPLAGVWKPAGGVTERRA